MSWRCNPSRLRQQTRSTECNECGRDHREAGSSSPAQPHLVHPGCVCHKWRRPLRGTGVDSSTTQKCPISKQGKQIGLCTLIELPPYCFQLLIITTSIHSKDMTDHKNFTKC